MAHDRAGRPARAGDLEDLPHLVTAYYSRIPDPAEPAQQVAFGTSGHRGSSLDCAFNEAHILAITQAIVEYRATRGITGPVYLARDTHALSEPAWTTALEVLAANDVTAVIDSRGRYTPTPALSHAVLRHNRGGTRHQADGIVVTPSHNPPRDGGFKYNPPHGGPADTVATDAIADRANELLRGGLAGIKRTTLQHALATGVQRYDYLDQYIADLPNVLNLDAVRGAGIRLGADPMGGASVDYWEEIGQRYDLELEVVNPFVDPTWRFMTLDSDGKIRMDPSSRYAMASLVAIRDDYDISTGNDADADRHGIVTPDAGLMNPNHFLAVAIEYLVANRMGWDALTKIGKTAVTSSMIDRVVGVLGRQTHEVPVGFKWFVPGLFSGSLAFGGEESAGASFLRHDGTVWTTDKDGILLALLAAEITAVTGQSPSARYAELEKRYGTPAYARIDAVANAEQKRRLAALTPDDIATTEIAGESVLSVQTRARGNGAALGGVKVTTENAWFAARPSGTEDKYKIYAESFEGPEHLTRVQAAAEEVVGRALGIEEPAVD
ncbi:phosphoglucomutase, alpha-D-glucose phosphate-specific [Nocardia sp. 852002-20019_SCH5090214]|jgi:phosphoglucomutase|uniref:Alpha-D-glucose phosphate-specific phosphoglucomutase n=1 Tax=Nocardia nova TaxID=37330 RepID=A0A2S6A3U4_9NOCA|nr:MULTISPECIES: phosphoglucomutase (alpha-D-glucose-1,6-bisphosphate-dependent) [Nocardia]OBF83660.1 phosphoglucomutase, alpha-D-glucose phosphate-specific [Mycobacterium sp. 852002-51759_SCH5129042]MBF6276325.1 alpha-D-glucose phosphate-specific phosphoglucomutase [Nocardia nova]MBV7705755.1 phosphoglucomutase (alpha-D-glucose-1,6-bisphosphate-dependent) [Nocardia nova]OBA46080.1 phosphoglucomutase, alpha-D-glucose phosphate-specific [Nocardia sp. 852002-51101_SCH5132738]OBA67871.1 phosphogl